MTPELAKWLIGAVAGGTATVIGAVVWLSVLVFRIGQKYGRVELELEKFELATSKLERALEKLEAIPVLVTKVEQIEESHAEERRRFASDWPQLTSKVDRLWEKVFSINEWRRSRPKLGGQE